MFLLLEYCAPLPWISQPDLQHQSNPNNIALIHCHDCYYLNRHWWYTNEREHQCRSLCFVSVSTTDILVLPSVLSDMPWSIHGSLASHGRKKKMHTSKVSLLDKRNTTTVRKDVRRPCKGYNKRIYSHCIWLWGSYQDCQKISPLSSLFSNEEECGEICVGSSYTSSWTSTMQLSHHANC